MVGGSIGGAPHRGGTISTIVLNATTVATWST